MVLHRTLTLLGCALIASPSLVWAQEAAAPAQATPPPRASGALALLRQLDEGFVEVFNKVAPSVVIIDTTKRANEDEGDSYDFFFRSPDDDSRKQFRMPAPNNRSEGSGFLIRQDGYILTNNHVIEGAEKISVKLKDGRQFPAKVIGADDRSDIAIIKIDASGLPAAQFGNSDTLRIGQIVCAIGVPFALDYSFTIGCVSGKGRTGFSDLTYEDYIQTDAFINPGNSGGPLFDVEGRVVGMNTLINGIGRGLAFAIPSNMLQEVSEQLITTGKISRPWLGIRIETLEEDSSLRDQIQGIDKGVVINTIEPDAPAYRSDLRPADVITAVDGVPVATARELQKQILAKKVGQVVSLDVWRGGKTLTLPVTTGELPASSTMAAAKGAQEEGTSPKSDKVYGLQLGDVTKEAADRLGTKPGGGALVTQVEPDSPASIAKIQADDIITEIDSKPVKDAASAQQLLQAHDSKKAVLLFLERKGQKTYAVLKIEE